MLLSYDSYLNFGLSSKMALVTIVNSHKFTGLSWFTSFSYPVIVGAQMRLISRLRNTEEQSLNLCSFITSPHSPPPQMCCQVNRQDVSLHVFVLWCQDDSSSAACCGTGVGKQRPQWGTLAFLSRLTLSAGNGQRLISGTATLCQLWKYLMILFHFCSCCFLSLLPVISHFTLCHRKHCFCLSTFCNAPSQGCAGVVIKGG